MFDKLRQTSMDSDPDAMEAEPVLEAAPARRSLRMPSVNMPRVGVLSALTPPQRFVLALMLFLNVSVLGFFALVGFEKIDLTLLLPF